MPSATGIGRKFKATSPNIRRWSNTIAYNELRKARKHLRGAAAYCRTVMRNGFKKGSTTKYVPPAGQFRAGQETLRRSRSRSPKPPNYHTKGGQWGIKSIYFTKLDRDTYSVAPKSFKSKGAKNSRFNIPEMLEFGGSGQIKVLASDTPTANGGVFSKLLGKGGKWPTIWSTARYKKRPYASITVKATTNKFHNLYVR